MTNSRLRLDVLCLLQDNLIHATKWLDMSKKVNTENAWYKNVSGYHHWGHLCLLECGQWVLDSDGEKQSELWKQEDLCSILKRHVEAVSRKCLAVVFGVCIQGWNRTTSLMVSPGICHKETFELFTTQLKDALDHVVVHMSSNSFYGFVKEKLHKFSSRLEGMSE